MIINEIYKELETSITFLTLHIKFIFKPQELVNYILKETNKKLFVKSLLLIIINYTILKIIIELLNTEKIINYKQIPLVIISLSIIYSVCFISVFISLKLDIKERIKLAIFSSIFIFSTILPIQIIILVCFLITESYIFYFLFLIYNFISTCYIFLFYPIYFNEKSRRAISIFFTSTFFILINSGSYYIVNNRAETAIFLDPIFHEFMEIQPHYLEIAMYVNNNNILLNDFMIKFSDGFDYAYYDMLRNQMTTIINKKNEVVFLSSKIIFNRNKIKLNLILEIIEIYEKILFEYNRLILNSSQNYFHELGILISEMQMAIENAKEKIQSYSDRIDELIKLNVDIPQEMINEGYDVYNEVKVFSDDNERKIKILTANIEINSNAINEINSLIPMSTAIINALIHEEEKSTEYLKWRIRIPF